MGKVFIAMFFVLSCSLGHAAVLQGYGAVERCYKVPDKSIPLCGGGAYPTSRAEHDNYCYIPSLGCNVLVVVEGYVSYQPNERGKLYEDIPIVSNSEYNGAIGYSYCRMLSPYVGFFVGQNWGIAPFSDARDCMGLYIYNAYDDYNCYQRSEDADDSCLDDFVNLFWGEEDEKNMLSALFATELVAENPCEIGVSRLVLSTGDSFPLWAEKYTEPALVLQYNNQKCYAKLEVGRGTLNLNFNDTVYHVVE